MPGPAPAGCVAEAALPRRWHHRSTIRQEHGQLASAGSAWLRAAARGCALRGSQHLWLKASRLMPFRCSAASAAMAYPMKSASREVFRPGGSKGQGPLCHALPTKCQSAPQRCRRPRRQGCRGHPAPRSLAGRHRRQIRCSSHTASPTAAASGGSPLKLHVLKLQETPLLNGEGAYVGLPSGSLAWRRGMGAPQASCLPWLH